MSPSKKFRPDVDAPDWGGKYFPYDIVKEGTVALVVVLILVLGLSWLFSSPDDKQQTLQTWSQADPVDFATTAFTELNGTSGVAGYGAPYNNGGGEQSAYFLHLQKWMGVRIPVNTANDFVLYPLSTLANNPPVTNALHVWASAINAQQAAWMTAYGAGTIAYANGVVTNSATGTGPLPVMINGLTAMARQGALAAQIIQGNGFYSTDYTKPALFLADGTYLENLARAQNLGGDQWGMMNETGSWPGQPWLWAYTTLYQIPPYSTSWGGNADVAVWLTMMIATVILALLPFIPGLRSIPRWVKVYRLIWREHYKSLK